METRKGHGKSWNVEIFKEYEPCCSESREFSTSPLKLQMLQQAIFLTLYIFNFYTEYVFYRNKAKVNVLSVHSQTDKLTGPKNINGQILNNAKFSELILKK